MNLHDITESIHSDERGWVANPFEGFRKFDMKKGHLHTGSIEPGAVRGNHFHPEAHELIFTFGGDCLWYWEEDGVINKSVIAAERAVVVEIPPKIAHAVRNISENTVYFLSYQNETLNKTLAETRKKTIYK